MSGKLVILGLVLTIAVALIVRTFEVAWRHDASQADLDVSRTAIPNHAQAHRDGSIQTDERAASQPLNRQHPPVDPARVVPADEDRTRDHAATQIPSKTGGRNQEDVDALGTTPESGFVDESVVGQPLPVSESILARCAKSPGGACEPNKALLAKMAEEPREEPWASAAERAIRALVELEPGTERPRSITFTIRALECRRTICFVETASHMEAFHTQFFYFESANELNAKYSMFSSETKSDGTEVYVTLLPVVRR